MNRYVRHALATVAVVAAFTGGVALVAPAHATPAPVCGTWKMRGATGAYPAVTFGGAPAGSEVDDFSAALVKPAEGVQPGVEFAVTDLDIEADADLQVSVDYELSGGASPAAGAVRMFGYQEQDADTLNDGPDYGPAIADATGGTLSFTVAEGKSLGTLGLVYDASNDSAGTVTFTGLTIGQAPVRFTTCPQPSPSSASPSASASASPSAGASVSPSVSRSSEPAVIGRGASLPVTGPGIEIWVLAGLVLIVVGIAFVMIPTVRRRKVNRRA